MPEPGGLVTAACPQACCGKAALCRRPEPLCRGIRDIGGGMAALCILRCPALPGQRFLLQRDEQGLRCHCLERKEGGINKKASKNRSGVILAWNSKGI